MPELTITSFNSHWGRGAKRRDWPAFDVTATCAAFEADVIVLQESWAPDGGRAQHEAVADELGMRCVAVPMARARMDPRPRIIARAQEGERRGSGDCCLALLSRKPIRTTRVLPLPRPLPWDPWSRVLLHAEIDVDGTNLTLVATHFAHLEQGAILQTRALRKGLPPTDRAAAFVGDMNMWGWTMDVMAPKGWRRTVRGKTWPAWRPQHQIDHLLVTPSVEVVHAEVLPDQGSDHRPIRARLRVT